MGNPYMGLFPEMVTTTPRYGLGKVHSGGVPVEPSHRQFRGHLTKIGPKYRPF